MIRITAVIAAALIAAVVPSEALAGEGRTECHRYSTGGHNHRTVCTSTSGGVTYQLVTDFKHHPASGYHSSTSTFSEVKAPVRYPSARKAPRKRTVGLSVIIPHKTTWRCKEDAPPDCKAAEAKQHDYYVSVNPDEVMGPPAPEITPQLRLERMLRWRAEAYK